MPLPALPVIAAATGEFLIDIIPAAVGGLAGGILINGFQKKPTKMEIADQYADRFLKYAEIAKTFVGFADWAFGTKGKKAENEVEKLKAEMESAQFDRELKRIAVEKAQLELNRLKNGEDDFSRGEVDDQHRAGMAGIPSRKRTKKPTASPPSRRAAT